MRVLICGARDWTNRKLIADWIQYLKDWGCGTIIEGECRGADIMAREEAQKAGFTSDMIQKFPADWNRYHKAAGAIRNTQMLVEGKPDLVLAFHNDIQNSKGTRNMIEQAKNAGVEVILEME